LAAPEFEGREAGGGFGVGVVAQMSEDGRGRPRPAGPQGFTLRAWDRMVSAVVVSFRGPRRVVGEAATWPRTVVGVVIGGPEVRAWPHAEPDRWAA